MLLHCSRSLVVLAVLAAGCSDSTQPCIALPATPPIAFQPAVVVGISDSITGKPVADSASGTVRSIVASDSLHHGYGQMDSIVYGMVSPGTYTVMVQRPGYIPWYRYNVVVAAGNCGMAVPANLTARLKPSV